MGGVKKAKGKAGGLTEDDKGEDEKENVRKGFFVKKGQRLWEGFNKHVGVSIKTGFSLERKLYICRCVKDIDPRIPSKRGRQ